MNDKKADVKREVLKDHPGEMFAKDTLVRGAQAVKPFGLDHEGSVVIHFYRRGAGHDYAFIVQQTGLQSIPEGQADMGFKEMKRHMMAVYGREAPKERTA